jgi:hypothetical protein
MNIYNSDLNKILNDGKLDDEYQVIKDMEDLIINLFKTNGKSEILKDNIILLNDASYFDIIKLYKDFTLECLNIESFILDNIKNIIFTGSYQRQIFIPHEINTDLELFINFFDINLDNSIDINLIKENYTETESNYYKKVNINNQTIIIYINKQSYRSISECLLLNSPFKRCGIYDNKILISNMFICDYYRKNNLLLSGISDPVFDTMYDPFEIYDRKSKTDDIFELISRKNYNEFKEKYSTFSNKKLYNVMYKNLTCIEYALHLYINETYDYIKENLINIILKLNTNEYFRHIYHYANIIKLKEQNEELYYILKLNDYVDIHKFNNITNIDEFNNNMINYFINSDDDTLYSYLININKKLDKHLIDSIISKNPESIIKSGINNNYISEYNIYKIILLSEQLDYFKVIDKFNINIAMNFIKDIIDNNLIKSFYFIYKIDNSMIFMLDDNGNTLIHLMEDDNDILDLIVKIDSNILRIKNKNETNCLLYNINKSPKLIKKIINLIYQYNETYLFDDYDDNGNNIIHHLILNNLFSNDEQIEIIKNILKTNINLLNSTTSNKMTPIMLSTQCKNEELFYLFKSINADMDIVDKYGNSVYHYICLNEIAIGTSIINKENYFGYTPKDYCKISTEYYYWI